MDVTYREEVSPAGVKIKALLSAMQKCARRSMRDEMEFAVRELCAFLDVELEGLFDDPRPAFQRPGVRRKVAGHSPVVAARSDNLS
jgi:hypothetical protein